ncbi:uncharacterized protein LOC106156709 [Lingula anatina]|uniref:Uncharacterized protein LOC106156709 n=1 Tax=Lingula anatina TaxID=7574 RepID=A0A1S3HNB6_LINAN|nr:uncharacterized protein LOC106156709 [Lingula anatina]|eukprot:XP_013387553.1 uncharacterized protein LOC106156709 [Lingula anatina]
MTRKRSTLGGSVDVETTVGRDVNGNTAGVQSSTSNSWLSLPDELWARIFIYLKPVEDQLPRLGTVCSKWRRVLQNTPFLWRTVHIDPVGFEPWQYGMVSTILTVYGKHIQKLTWRDSAPVYEAIFVLITKLPALKTLRLPILWTERVVNSLSRLSTLEAIQINGGYVLKDSDLELLVKSYRQLKSVSLNACWGLTARGVLNFLQNLSSLEVVKLKVNSNLQLNHHRSESAMMAGLRTVQGVSDSRLAGLVTVLCIHFVPIEMEELWGVINNLTNLKKLSVSNCERLHGIRLVSNSLQKLYLYNLWNVSFVSVTGFNLRSAVLDYGMESLEHLEILAPTLRRLQVDGSGSLRTLNVKSDRLAVAELSHCDKLEADSLRTMLGNNETLVCLRLGKISGSSLHLDEVSCPYLQEICLLSDFSCSTLHIRGPSLRLLHADTENDLGYLQHLYVVANHLCKVSLHDVPALRTFTIQCVSVDCIDVNICSDVQLCLNSCIIQACGSIGLLRLFDCALDLLAVCTPVASTIVLYRCQLTDYVLQMALQGCSNISYLNLEKCLALRKLSIESPSMKYVNLYECHDVQQLNMKCPQLCALNLGHCNREIRVILNEKELDFIRLNPLTAHPRIVPPLQSIRWTHDIPPHDCQL